MHVPSADLWQLPARVRSLIEGELNDGEKIMWIGTPIARQFAMRSLPVVLFAIPWTAFAIFWMAGASGFKIPDFTEGFSLFPLFGIPFVLIGFAMLSSPVWMMHKAKRTAYVITTDRAIIFAGGFSTTIRSFSPDRLTDLRRKQRPDGSGDLVFERQVSRDSDGDRQTTDHGFLAVANVKSVEDMVRKLVDRASQNKA
jgi:hypothetical protein